MQGRERYSNMEREKERGREQLDRETAVRERKRAVREV